MYNVHMKRYTMSSARQQLAQVLDEVEQGEAVVLERRGVRFRLVVEKTKKPETKLPRPFVTLLDPNLLEDGWTWEWTNPGLRFVPGKKRRK